MGIPEYVASVGGELVVDCVWAESGSAFLDDGRQCGRTVCVGAGVLCGYTVFDDGGVCVGSGVGCVGWVAGLEEGRQGEGKGVGLLPGSGCRMGAVCDRAGSLFANSDCSYDRSSVCD